MKKHEKFEKNEKFSKKIEKFEKNFEKNKRTRYLLEKFLIKMENFRQILIKF